MDTREIIIGNICSIGAMITDSISGTRKKNSEILGIQILSQVFYGAGSIILRGYSGTTQNLVAIFRKLAGMKDIKNKLVEWILVAAGVVLGILFNNRGLLGWLPIIANLIYSVAIFMFRDNDRALKMAFVINMVMYCAFGLVIKNYVGAAANIVVAVTTAISLFKTRNEIQ